MKIVRGSKKILKRVYKNTVKTIDYLRNHNKDTEDKIRCLEEQVEWFKAHSDIRKLKPATGFLRRKQLLLVDFALDFFNEVSLLNIHPFLICGNLIGAYRHGGYVPWDDDLDFGLIRSEYESLIEYCRKHYVVNTYQGNWNDYTEEVHMRRMDELVKRYPGQYILDIWLDQIQIMKGTNCIDRLAIDFWAFDYYAEEYSIEKHMEYLNELSRKKREIGYVDQIVDYLNDQIKNNSNISSIPTSKVFPGIDDVEGYLRISRTKDWLLASDLFPLKKVKYEDTEFYAPNNIENWLLYEYPNYNEYPKEVGIMPHEGYKERYILDHFPVVEFYLVDAFEIYHFMPLYYYFERNGIYPCFVAEQNTEDAWFDYKEAIAILEMNGVRYKKTPNYSADFVFTTQAYTGVRKYRKKKIHMCYGVGLTDYSFSESKSSTEGFDLKLVHGQISYNATRLNDDHIKMIIMGYPRYSYRVDCKYLYETKSTKQRIDSENRDDKPILTYFPTWDNGSSIDQYAEEINKLRDKYFVVTKAHHCTYRLESETEHRRILNEISDVVLEGNYSFEDATLLGDIAICDAISGAATEVPFINETVRLILLYSPIEDKNRYKDFIDDYAYCVKKTEDLRGAVEMIEQEDRFYNKRREFLRDIYENRTERALEEMREYIFNCYFGGKNEKEK